MSGKSFQVADRRRDIIRVVGDLFRALDRWNDDLDQSRIEPDSDLATCIDVAVSTVSYGDVPHDCRAIAERMGRLREEFAAYNSREKASRNGEPLPVFWGALRDVFEAFRVVRVQCENRVFEPVAKLLKDGATEHNVAVHYGGQKRNGVWTGIFFNSNGAPRSDLIAKEAAEPGSVVPSDFVHPEDLERRGQLEQQYQGHLERLQAIEDDPKEDRLKRASAEQLRELEPQVVKYLTVEKGFPHQAAKAFGLSIEQVNDIAKRNAIATETEDGEENAEPKPDDTPPTIEKTPEATPEAVRAAAIELFAGSDHDNKGVARELSRTFGVTIKAQRVAALRSSWLKSQQAAEEPETADAA